MGLDSSQAEHFTPPGDLIIVNILGTNVNLDFSGISSITSVKVRDGDGIVTFDPTNITSINNANNEITFSDGKVGGIVSCKSNKSKTLQNVLNSFNKVNFEAYYSNFSFGSFINCDKIVSLLNDGGNVFTGLDRLTGLQKIDLKVVNDTTGITISDASTLENLTSVKIDKPIGDDILTKLPIANLTTLELTDSKFIDCSPLLKAENLVTLRLDGGVIFDRFSYMDEAGVRQSNVSTLELFKNLQKQYKKLKNLYLSGCKNITDWSILENDKTVTWENWSGFNGK